MSSAQILDFNSYYQQRQLQPQDDKAEPAPAERSHATRWVWVPLLPFFIPIRDTDSSPRAR